MERKNLIRDLIVLWISIGAFMCAAINLHLLRNKIESKES